MKLIVNNERRVSEFLGTNIKVNDDLYKFPDIIEKLKPYKHYFESLKREDFKEFFDKTGIILGHYYKSYGDNHNTIVFSMYGSSNSLPLNFTVSNYHLLILDDDMVQIKDNKVYLDKEEIYELDADDIIDFDNDNIIRERLAETDDVNEQMNILYEFYDKEVTIDIDNICKMILSPFHELFILDDDGNLYCDNKLYDKDVAWIFSLDYYTNYIIFKDNHIEYISAKSFTEFSINADKVIGDDHFIAYLRNKNVKVLVKTDIPNTSVTQWFSNVDDIEYLSNEQMGLVINGNRIILDVECIFVENDYYDN